MKKISLAVIAVCISAALYAQKKAQVKPPPPPGIEAVAPVPALDPIGQPPPPPDPLKPPPPPPVKAAEPSTLSTVPAPPSASEPSVPPAPPKPGKKKCNKPLQTEYT